MKKQEIKKTQDIEKVIADISSEPLSGAHLTAKKVKEPDCILVDGLSRETSLKIIQYYFGNEKESGGTGVRDVQQGPTDTQAIVYFEDWKAVGDVLSKRSPHKIGDTELLVEEYHECLGRLSPVDVPTPHVPKPVIVQVQEPIMEFIFGKGQHTKTKLIQKIRNAKAILKWPDGDDKTSARLEPLLEDRQGQSSWLQWSETASRVVTDFLNRCKSSRIAVPPPFWKDVIDSIDQLSTKSFSIQPDASTHVVTLTGEQQDVDKGCNDIDRIIEKSRAKAEYEAQHKEEGITLTEEKSQFFIMCGIKDNIEKDFPNLKITVISLQDKIKLIFEGSREIVQEAELSMRRQMDSLERVELKTGRNKVRFVQNVTDKIHEILRSQSIRAACNGSDDGKIVISGASKKDTVQAKAYIDQEIREVDIAIKDQAAMDVLQSPNGQRLLEEINRQKSVMVAISNYGGNIVEFAGFKDNLGATKQKVMDFLKDNVIVRKTVPANKNKVYLITKFHGQDLVNLEKQNARNHVKIQQLRNGGNKGFVIQGNEEGSEAARQAIASLIDRIKGQQYPVSKTGMAQLLREQKGRRFLESLESDHECVIRENVKEDSDGEAKFEESTALRPVVPTKVLCRIALPNGFTLKVCRGDLTRQKVDCIVNAANTKLNHDTGLAAAIVEAGGKVIQDECEQILKTKGRRLFMGEAVHTTNGKLPCKTVIHVAGPKWPHRRGATSKSADDEPTSEERLLCGSIINCLKLANKLNLQSIAIPAISTGVYGFPVDLAAKQILNAVAEFCQNTPDPTLTEIHFINNDQPTCDVFRTAVMDRFSQFHVEKDGTDVDKLPGGESWDPPIVDFVPQTAHASARAPAPAQAPAPRITSFGQTILTTMEGINITLKKGSITSETVDVIVNTAGTDMKLSEGAVSKAILQAAGQALQLECSTVTSTRGKIPAGEYIETGPAALTCKKVYHCVCESYSPARAEQFLKELVHSLMEHAEQDGMLSIAIPALGTGNLNYPADVTARVMYESVLEFSSQHPNGVLKDVRFVVYEKDVSTVQCFESEIQRLMTPATPNGATGFIPSGHEKKLINTVPLSGPRGTSGGSPVVGGVPQPVSSSALAPRFTSPRQNILTTMEGINITLKKGSITDETVDIIVNTAGSDMNLSGGAVSKAILQAAGQRLQLACNNVISSRGNILPGEFIETGPANLTCKTIYHCVCEKYSPARAEKVRGAMFLKELVLSLMEHAEQDGMLSIAIPALGTGILDYPADVTARVMYESVLEFSSQHPNGVLKDVRFVVYEKDTKTAQVDVIVNTAGTDMNLSEGAVSKALLRAAGKALQLECSTVTSTRGKIPAGEFIQTGPAALTCKKIYHCVCEKYSPATAEKFLKKLVLSLMEHAEQDGMVSIAIPALGTGILDYPADVTARVMYESVLEFSSQHPNGVLKDVHFVVYDKDVKTIKCFEGQIQTLTSATPGGTAGLTPVDLGKKLKQAGSSQDCPEKPDVAQMSAILSASGLKQHVTEPTHAQGHTLDWLVTRINEDG
ncbi:protein mono-ADP-ribosyltransferase PARP14-like [Patiria miniata]|uniref:Macro domain-containing protein n=1 Tax=Patiria miniata TaxID=46514 RepID=A0A914B580_PATMI|nr:protein mono-ADP-ribosyltransferase PARP14-like [Patiria miniata]